jgi:hypothetical protein
VSDSEGLFGINRRRDQYGKDFIYFVNPGFQGAELSVAPVFSAIMASFCRTLIWRKLIWLFQAVFASVQNRQPKRIKLLLYAHPKSVSTGFLVCQWCLCEFVERVDKAFGA